MLSIGTDVRAGEHAAGTPAQRANFGCTHLISIAHVLFGRSAHQG